MKKDWKKEAKEILEILPCLLEFKKKKPKWSGDLAQ